MQVRELLCAMSILSFLVMHTTPHDSLIVKDAQSANLLILDGSQAMRARQATARELDTTWLSNRYAGNTFKEPRTSRLILLLPCLCSPLPCHIPIFPSLEF